MHLPASDLSAKPKLPRALNHPNICTYLRDKNGEQPDLGDFRWLQNSENWAFSSLAIGTSVLGLYSSGQKYITRSRLSLFPHAVRFLPWRSMPRTDQGNDSKNPCPRTRL